METEELEDQKLDNSLPGDGGAAHEGNTPEPGEGEGGTPPTKPRSEEWKEAFKELATTVKQGLTPKKEEVKESPEQVAERWGVWNPTAKEKNFFKEFFNLPDDVSEAVLNRKIELFKQMHEGLVKQSIVGARNLYTEDLRARDAKLEALESWRNEASAKELRQNFVDTYPALGDKKYGKILKLVAQELGDKEFASHEEYFQALAEGADQAIKEFDPSFELGAKTKPSTPKSPSLPRTRVGGQGGAGNGGKAADPDADQSGSLKF